MDERIVYASYLIIWILCAVKAFYKGWLSKKNITTLLSAAFISSMCGIVLVYFDTQDTLIIFELYYVVSLIILHFIFRKFRRLQTDLFQFIVLTGLALPLGVIFVLFAVSLIFTFSNPY